MAFPPLVPPPGFIDDLGGGGGGGVGGAGGLAGAIGSALDLLADGLKNTKDLLPPIWPPNDNQSSWPPGSLLPPNERDSFKGPAPHPPGGRWPGVPGATGTWLLSGFIDRLANSDHRFQSRDTGIPASLVLYGPFLELISGSEYALRFESIQGDVKWEYYLPNPNISGGPFLINPETDEIVEIQARPSAFVPPQNPEKVEEDERYPPIIPGPPNPPPRPSTNPPGVPSTNPNPNPGPGPGTPNPNPNPGPDPGTPNPNPNPNPNPGPGPGTPNPNPNTFPGPATNPITFPSPFVPVVVPQVLPATTTPTNPDGSRQTAPIVGPITTPVGSEKIGPITIPKNSPQPTLEGIAGEVGRIEQKLASMIRPSAGDDLTDRIGLLGSILKAIYEQFFTGLPAGEYILSSPCERDEQGDRVEYQVPILQTVNKYDAIFERLDALANLIQTHKDLKQPICRGSQPTGQPVTVNFTQIE